MLVASVTYTVTSPPEYEVNASANEDTPVWVMVVPLNPYVVQFTVSGGVNPDIFAVSTPSSWQGGTVTEKDTVCAIAVAAQAAKTVHSNDFLIVKMVLVIDSDEEMLQKVSIFLKKYHIFFRNHIKFLWRICAGIKQATELLLRWSNGWQYVIWMPKWYKT